MEKHISSTMAIGRLDGIISKMNAIETSSQDDRGADLLGAIRVLAEGQKHCIGEIEHLKKAIDLLTLELFKVSSRHNSNEKAIDR
ncbi:MAG: hypothetical protein K8823_1477 [Cenarchaeum symbiont of Oopsacas minuta]|nr:hypothetical protein [Cenarchaeum symbiont of Oopsacas minuta]